jgi:hypothetical protein
MQRMTITGPTRRRYVWIAVAAAPFAAAATGGVGPVGDLHGRRSLCHAERQPRRGRADPSLTRGRCVVTLSNDKE